MTIIDAPPSPTSSVSVPQSLESSTTPPTSSTPPLSEPPATTSPTNTSDDSVPTSSSSTVVPDDTPVVPGSEKCPYRLAIVGGGPAGTSIIVRAIHLGVVDELCSFGAKRNDTGVITKQAGVCIFDASSPQRFGGGRLQDYVINSNTSGGKFVTNVVQDRLSMLPPEQASGTILEHLDKTPMGSNLSKVGANIAPLTDIGIFLVEVGGQVKKLLDYYSESSKYESYTQVTQLQQSECKQYWKITTMNIKTHTMTETYAYKVVLATGGTQKLPRLIPASRNKKLMSSDEICTFQGIEELKSRLENKDRKKIVIIGGSHSAFSAAWICLNKLTIFNSEFQIYIIHRTAIKVFYATKREAEKDKYYDYEMPNKCGSIHPFGGLRGDAKALYRSIRTGQETKIRLLCTGVDGGNHQTMANKLQEEAHVIIWACGYAANTCYQVLDAHGNKIKLQLDRGQVSVNDQAMVMYDKDSSPMKSIIHPSSPTALSKVAAGILNNTPVTVDTSTTLASPSPSKSTSTVPFSSPTPLRRQETTYEPVPVANLLGSGLGFGLCQGNDDTLKADGVAVYLKRGATLILSHVLGSKVFGEKANTWEQHVAINLKKCTMMALELHHEEKIQQKELKEQQKEFGLAVDSSPKKSSRNMMFDPTSPSNASTGIGSCSSIKRSISTAPGTSRIRGSSIVNNSSPGKSPTKHSVTMRKNNTTNNTNTNTNTVSCNQKGSNNMMKKQASNENITDNKRGATAHASSRSSSNKSSNTKSNDRKQGQTASPPHSSPSPPTKNISATSPVVSSPRTDSRSDSPPFITPSNNSSNSSSADEIIKGVSVLDTSGDVDEDPPPTYRSTETSEPSPSPGIIFPQLSDSMSRSRSLSIDEDSPTPTSSHRKSPENNNNTTISSPSTNKQTKNQNESLSRLCQPKAFTRASQIKKKEMLAKADNHKVTKMAPKVASEFVIDLPMAKPNHSKDFKGGNTKTDDTLTRLGSDNIHFNLLQSGDSNNSLLRPPSASNAPRRPQSRPQSGKNYKNDDDTNSSTAWEIQHESMPSSRRCPPTSPIVKKNKNTIISTPSLLKNQNQNQNQNINQQLCNEKKDLTLNPVDGPSVADILWAEKRHSSQHAPKKPSKTVSAVHHSPITKPTSTSRTKSSGGKRAHSSGGSRQNRLLNQDQTTVNGRRNNNNNNDSRSINNNDSNKKSQQRVPRSPVPASAPARSKRILSQSLTGPPVAMLRLPSLQSDSQTVTGGTSSGSGMYNRNITKPILVVKHEVFNHPAQEDTLPAD